jgi:hypothetical protein
VLHHQHGDAQLVLDVLDPEGHVVGFLHVQARRGLVQQQQRGSVHSARASSTTLRTP